MIRGHTGNKHMIAIPKISKVEYKANLLCSYSKPNLKKHLSNDPMLPPGTKVSLGLLL